MDDREKFGFKLIYQYDENNPRIVFEAHRDQCLDELEGIFTKFLLACGYSSRTEVTISCGEGAYAEENDSQSETTNG